MPTYEYECKKCGVFEIEQRITEDALKVCPECAKAGKTEAVARLISAPAFHLKGGGWYKDLYATTKKNDSSSKNTVEKSAPADSKPVSSESKVETPKKETTALKTTGGCGSGGCGCN